MKLWGYNINKNTVITFLISLLCMMVSTFCYYYLQKTVFTLSVMIFGISISCFQAFKCLKLLKKGN